MLRLKIRSFASSPGHTPIFLLARLPCSLLLVDGAGEADAWPRILVGTATLSAMRVMRLLVSAPLLLVGTLLALYGLFALAFNDRGGATYVALAGHRYDAHLVGAVSLVIALAVIAAGVAIGRRRSGV